MKLQTIDMFMYIYTKGPKNDTSSVSNPLPYIDKILIL